MITLLQSLTATVTRYHDPNHSESLSLNLSITHPTYLSPFEGDGWEGAVHTDVHARAHAHME
jgi:hypothetical protein